MKKLAKKLLAIIAIFVFALTPLAFVGCGGDMSNSDINAVVAKSAENFYSKHNSINNYSAITYHWVVNDKSVFSEPVDYVVDGEDKTDFFDNTRTQTEETTLAIKQEGDHVVAEMNIVSTTKETYKYADDQNDYALKDGENTTVLTKNYRMFTYVDPEDETVTKNILIFEMSQTINGEAQVIENSKVYGSRYDIDDYDYFSYHTLIYRANNEVEEMFFNLSEVIYFYSSLLTAKKDGNQVKLSMQYDVVGVNSDEWEVVNHNVIANTYYKDGKIWKTDTYSKGRTANGYSERKVAFDYTESANVNMTVPADFTGYTLNNNIFDASNNNFADALSHLPSASFFN